MGPSVEPRVVQQAMGEVEGGVGEQERQGQVPHNHPLARQRPHQHHPEVPAQRPHDETRSVWCLPNAHTMRHPGGRLVILNKDEKLT
jgi:hypothetical protein